MEDSFTIPVVYQGKELELEAQLLRMGYTYKIKVFTGDGVEVIFEKDDEGNFRAVLPAGTEEKIKNRMDIALLQQIAETLTESLS